jgi:hypothetical protein
MAMLSTALDCAPTPVGEAIERCQVLLAEAGKRRWESGMLGPLAHLEAMQGQFPVARNSSSGAERSPKNFGLRSRYLGLPGGAARSSCWQAIWWRLSVSFASAMPCTSTWARRTCCRRWPPTLQGTRLEGPYK